MEPVPLTFSSGGSQRGTQTPSGCVSAGERALWGEKGHAGLSEGSGLGGCLTAAVNESQRRRGPGTCLYAQGFLPASCRVLYPGPTLGTGASGTRAGLQSPWSVSVPGWHRGLPGLSCTAILATPAGYLLLHQNVPVLNTTTTKEVGRGLLSCI